VREKHVRHRCDGAKLATLVELLSRQVGYTRGMDEKPFSIWRHARYAVLALLVGTYFALAGSRQSQSMAVTIVIIVTGALARSAPHWPEPK
jgi:hypothetical protein